MSLSIEPVIGRRIEKPIYDNAGLVLPRDCNSTKNKVNLFLDSGVFASWKNGENIDIYEYIDYIKRNSSWIELYASLDKIPGVPGRHPTKEEVEESAKVSYQNQQIMKEAGLNPIPIVHQGESLIWLDKYLRDEEPYIGVSPQEDFLSWRGPDASIWLDTIFTKLTTKDGTPIVKTHGFGVGTHSLMVRYPWTSVDSTTWTHQANWGAITCPTYKSGAPDYLSNPLYVHVSPNTKRNDSGGTSARDKAKIQFGNLSRTQQDQVIKYVEEECGLTMTQVRYCDGERRKVLIHYWRSVGNSLDKNRRFNHRIKGLWL